MRYFYISLTMLLVISGMVKAQTFTSSNLPIVIIATDGGQSIPDEPGVLGNMKIIYRGPGQRNYVSDQNNSAYLNYNGRIDIEKRGSSSQTSPKRNYGVTTLMADNVTNNNVSLLGMPEENDWILGGMVFDTALIRDYLCDNLSRRLGNYASRTSYCEVMVNGDYKGLFLLQEKIKADDNRVDIHKITPSDNASPAITGGYITKADKTTGGDAAAWTMYAFNGSPVDYIHHFPKPENITFYQNAYIKAEFYKLETTAKNNDVSVVNGYPAIIDIPSFIDFMIINEFASNPDAYQYSTFFHKDKNGKLRAGPVWDLDLSFGNDLFMWGLDRSRTDLWYFQDQYYNNGSRFWYDLFNNSTFRCYLSKRWNEVTQPGQPLHPSSIEALIDEAVDSISEAVVRDYQRWNKLGSHQERIAAIKAFISERVTWMTTNLGSYSACSNVTVPPLVITRIMYHPAATAQYPDDDDLEYIEIMNNSDAVITLTGFYFMGTGFVYQFPSGSMLGARQRIIVASNAAAFRAVYGFLPFGQFTRHLSNNNQKLVLADAFGNIIDSLHYYDISPWPNADGNGMHLKLTDIELDNSIAVNWIATNETITSIAGPEDDTEPEIFPNPVRDYLYIRSVYEIQAVSLYDMNGRMLHSENVSCETCEIDMKAFAPGPYIVRIVAGDRVITRKIVRE